jgi:hypothetical protein
MLENFNKRETGKEMKKMRKIIGAIFIIAIIFSCSLKKQTVMVPGTGELCLKVEPASADVYVDGKNMGKANQFQNNPNCLELSSGRHLIQISHPGFAEYRTEIFVGSQATEWLKVKLSKEKGK